MKIKEFFESKESLAIKITTLDDLIKICEAFDKEGIMYSETSKYTDKLDIFIKRFEEHGDIGLSNWYYLKSYGYCEIDWYIKKNYTIITMNDIEFEEEMTVAEYIDSLNRENLERACIECYKLKNGRECGHVCSDCEFSKVVNLANYLNSQYIPPKQEITLTEFEKQLLLNLDDEYKYIAIDSKGILFAYVTKPTKINVVWANIDACQYIKIPLSNIFQFITWEDEEPTSIEMLKEMANEKNKD